MSILSKRRVVFVLVLLALVGGAVGGGIALYQAYYVGRFGEVVPGQLYRSRQPRGMQWSVLKRAGIRTVINLRLAGDNPADFRQEQERTAEAGVRLVHIPIGERVPTHGTVEQFIRAVRQGPQPVLVHCEHGRNRTGYTVAAYMIVMEGWSPDQGLASIREYGGNPTGDKLNQLMALFNELARDRDAWRRRTDPHAPPESLPASQPSTVPNG